MLPAQQFNEFIVKNQLFEPGSRLLAAVSGGMDSVLLVRLLKAAGYTFGIAHCNFQLRGHEADADEQFCRQLAHELEVPFFTTRFDTSAYAQAHRLSIQMAARDLRYAWFEHTRQEHQYTAIALAHHQNDAIETILLNLTRGTGIAGLHGILPRNGHLVRPLLFLTRQEIADITEQNQIVYREDSSNTSVKYARNKLRLEVIPRLKELNPGLEKTFAQNLSHFRELEQLLNHQLSILKEQLFSHHDNQIYIDLKGIRQLQPQQLLLYGLLKDYGFNQTTVNDVITALNKHSGRVFYSPAFSLLLDREQLILSAKTHDAVYAVPINEGDEEIAFGQTVLKLNYAVTPYAVEANPLIAVTDADLIIYPLTLRNWQAGDYFFPLGMVNRKKLSDFFISQKIPMLIKQTVPLLINGNGEVIWVGGYRLDNRYKVTPETKKVAIFELLRP